MPRPTTGLPTSYVAACHALHGQATRKVANNTHVVRLDGAVAVRLHETNVVTFRRDGSIELDTGGYQTRTTMDRIDACLRETPGQLFVTGSCESGYTGRRPMTFRAWRVVSRRTGTSCDFYDGIVIPRGGTT